ncbi:hypothetical protein OROGR_026279 [Orobanche gracilis]
MAGSHEQNPQVLFDALYHPEEQTDNVDPILHSNCSVKCQEENSPTHRCVNRKHLLEFLEQDFSEDEELISLLNQEQGKAQYDVFEEKKNSSLGRARCEAVEWMLKVIGYYSFSALTAVLAVNYLDRFLQAKFKSSGEEKPWMTQLAAVACLSLAAKVEETRVPLLVDLQVEESEYVFESKTIQRMEILILSTLGWKMNPVTPLSFLEYLATRLKFSSHLRMEFLRRCDCLLLSIISDCRFMCYMPSALATAVMAFVISNLEPCIGVEYQEQLLGILGTNKDEVKDCCEVIEEVATSVNFHSSNKRKFGFGTMHGSPKGVVDVSFSSDSSDDSWGGLVSPLSSFSSLPEPLPSTKKIRSQTEEEEEEEEEASVVLTT